MLALAADHWLRCEVRDISLGGCYLVRSTEFAPADPLESGEGLRLWLFHPGQGDGFFVEGEVVREEGGGRGGVAVRFLLAADVAARVVDHVFIDAQAQKIPKAALGVPVLRYPEPSFAAARRVTGAVWRATWLGIGIGVLWVIWSIVRGD